MGGQTISTSETRVEALKLQSSAYGVTIPLVLGKTRIKGNMVWYGGFKAVPTVTEQGGKGGGVKVQNTTYTYYANVMMALCRGQITDVPKVWRGKKLYEGGIFPINIQTTSEDFTVPGSGVVTVSQAATFAAVALVRLFGSTGHLNNIPLSQGLDYSFVAGVFAFHERWIGLVVRITYQYTTGTIQRTALEELDLTFLAGAIGQEAWSALASFPDRRIGYSGLAIVAGQDYLLGSGAQVENHNFEVVGPMAYHLGSELPDVDLSLALREILTMTGAGAAFPGAMLDTWQSWSDFCVASGLLVSPALEEQIQAAEVVRTAADLSNTGPVWSEGRLKMIPYGDAAVTGNGRTFTPDTTPVYDLDDDCYTPRSLGESPVRVELKAPSDRYNHIRVEFRDRANQYNIGIAEAKDQADIDTSGLRTMPTVVAHWICERSAAQLVAQLKLQRSLYVCASYRVPLPWHFALLEPMDLVTLTDTRLQMDKLPVRALVIEETEEGDLEFEFEDYPPGQASAALYPSQTGIGFAHDYNASPGSVATPMIIELPGEMAASGLEIGVAARGTDPMWGGCRVWVSMDGTQYRQVGIIEGGSRYGVLTTDIDPPTQFGVLLNGGQLLSGTAADAAALNTLCYIGGSAPEFLAYTTATLTGSNAYTLAGLVRGAYQSNSASAHAAGDPFVRVDDAIARSGAIDRGYIGKTIYVKCTSFNVFGGAEQSLADVSAFSYAVTGRMFGRRKSFRVGAAGYAASSGPISPALYDAESMVAYMVAPAIAYYARSYMMARIRRSDGVVTHMQIYDVFANGTDSAHTPGYPRGYEALATDLNATGNDSIVVVWTVDEPSANRLMGNLPAAMYRCGASRAVFGSPQFAARSAYVLVGIAGCGEGNGLESYQGAPIAGGDPNAWCDVSFQVANGSLIVTGAGATPRTLADYSYTGDLNATSDVTLIAHGVGMTISGNTATKPATGAGTWDSGVYSRQAFAQGAFAAWTVAQADRALMVGLNQDPTASAVYDTIDAAIYCTGDGTVEVYESGAQKGVYGTYAAGDTFAVHYDGATVRYIRNGTVLASTPWLVSVPLYLDSSFYAPGGQITNVRFGPLSPVVNIGTPQLAGTSVNETLKLTSASYGYSSIS